jgi:hypothetical protein
MERYDNVDSDSLEVSLRHLFSVLTISTAMLFATVAHADTLTNDFSFVSTTDGGGYSGTFTFEGTTDPYNAHAFDATSITGTVTGPGGTASLFMVPLATPADSQNPVADPSGYTVDDVFYEHGVFNSDSTGTPFDIDGLLLEDTNGNYYNLVGMNTITALYPSNGMLTIIDLKNLTQLAAAPEPSSLALCSTGVLALAGAVRRKVRKS